MVDTVNNCNEFDIEYPAEEVMKQSVANDFAAISDVGSKHVQLQ